MLALDLRAVLGVVLSVVTGTHKKYLNDFV